MSYLVRAAYLCDSFNYAKQIAYEEKTITWGVNHPGFVMEDRIKPAHQQNLDDVIY